MSVAKPMISEVFSSSMPTIVTASFASSYLLAMAGGELQLKTLSTSVGADEKRCQRRLIVVILTPNYY